MKSLRACLQTALLLAGIAAGPAATPMTSPGPLQGTDVGWGPCVGESDYDFGFCWALYNEIADADDCWLDAPSDEFVEGCLAFLGEEWPDEPPEE